MLQFKFFCENDSVAAAKTAISIKGLCDGALEAGSAEPFAGPKVW